MEGEVLIPGMNWTALLAVGGAIIGSVFALLKWFMTRTIADFEERLSRIDVVSGDIEKVSDLIEQVHRDIDAKLDDHAARITRLEVQTHGAPTHADLRHVYEKIGAVSAQVSSMGGKLDGIDANLRLLMARMTETRHEG